MDENGEKIGRSCYSFMIRTKNVDTAKLVITAWVNAKLKENARKAEENGDYDPAHTAEISITAAAPFNVEGIIEREFCEVYYITQQTTIEPGDRPGPSGPPLKTTGICCRLSRNRHTR